MWQRTNQKEIGKYLEMNRNKIMAYLNEWDADKVVLKFITLLPILEMKINDLRFHPKKLEKKKKQTKPKVRGKNNKD